MRFQPGSYIETSFGDALHLFYYRPVTMSLPMLRNDHSQELVYRGRIFQMPGFLEFSIKIEP